MLLFVVAQVTRCAHREEIPPAVVLRVLVEMGDGEDFSPVAPPARLAMNARASPPVRLPADAKAFAAPPGAPEADVPRNLGPVSRVELTEFRSYRHQSLPFLLGHSAIQVTMTARPTAKSGAM